MKLVSWTCVSLFLFSCAGMLLERLDGKPVTKVLKQPYFHDCQFVYDLLQSVFTTLDVAQAAVGFHHADFRLANVSILRSSFLSHSLVSFPRAHCKLVWSLSVTTPRQTGSYVKLAHLVRLQYL
jgi:hypothetical protein